MPEIKKKNLSNDLDSLLDLDNLDGIPGQNAPPEGGQAGQEADKDAKLAEKVTKMEGQNKELTENVRQLSENNKVLSDFHDKITGADKVKEQQEKDQELRRRMEDDPVETTRELIKEQNAPMSEDINIIGKTAVVDRAMQALDKNYDVDWAKHSDAIQKEMAALNPELLKTDPETALLKAASLVPGALKKRTAATPTEITPGRPGAPTKKEVMTESKRLNDKLDKIGKRKKDNIFGL